MLSPHPFPSLLADDAGANKHVIFQRNTRGHSVNRTAQRPIFFPDKNQEIYIRPGITIASRL